MKKNKIFQIVNVIIGAILGFTISSLVIMTNKYNESQKIEHKYDLNGDGFVTTSDYIVLRNYIMEKYK